MKKTSFGSINSILELHGKTVAEYLVFAREGRRHKHLEYESFAVLSGEGQVVSGEQTFAVRPGDVVTIPPGIYHWMIPKEGQEMTGLLWYHQQAGQSYSTFER